MIDYNSLIPEMKNWDDGKGVDIRTWIDCIGDYKKAIGYSAIFWPEFKEVNGCIVNADREQKNIMDWINSNPKNPRSVEPIMNHFHIFDLHYGDNENVNAKILIHLGSILKEIYECKLKRDFPDKNIIVEFYQPDDKDDLEGYELTFYQK